MTEEPGSQGLMRVLLFGDLHGDADATRRIATQLKRVDYGFCLGDSVSFGRELQQALDLLDVGTELYALPGNHETEEAMRRGCAEHSHLHYFHGQHVALGTTTFAGLGGGVEAGLDMPFELSADAATVLLKGFCKLLNLVLISHTPPYNTAVDLARGDQHIGARSIRSFVLEAKPAAVYSGHVHEAEGKTDSLGSTRLRAVGSATLWKSDALALYGRIVLFKERVTFSCSTGGRAGSCGYDDQVLSCELLALPIRRK